MKAKKAPRQKHVSDKFLWVLYGLLGLLVVLYILNNSIFIGLATIVLIVIILVAEFSVSINQEGMRKTLIDIGVALGAVAVVWVLLVIILGTLSPIDVVSSCSMLPNLQRGELVFIHGIGNTSQFLESHDIPIVNVSNATFASFIDNMQTEFLQYYAYTPGNKSDISDLNGIPIYNPGDDVGLYNVACLDTFSEKGQVYNYARCTVPLSYQDNNLIKYNYSIGNVSVGGRIVQQVYTSSITIGSTTLQQNYSNPIVVYRTNASDLFTGDIIHRVYAAIRVGNRYFTITKGDNNPVIDIEDLNYPSSQENVVGYYIAGVPYVGYLKLIVTGQFESIPQCGQVTLR